MERSSRRRDGRGKARRRVRRPDRVRSLGGCAEAAGRFCPTPPSSARCRRPGKLGLGAPRPGAAARGPRRAGLGPDARARAPGVRRRSLDARPGAALFRFPRMALGLSSRSAPFGPELARHGERAAGRDRCPPPGGRGRAGPRAGSRAGARGAAVRRPHGHRRVAERVPRGLAGVGQRPGGSGSHPVRPQADAGPRPRLSVRAARREGAAAVAGRRRSSTFACGGAERSACVWRRARTVWIDGRT